MPVSSFNSFFSQEAHQGKIYGRDRIGHTPSATLTASAVQNDWGPVMIAGGPKGPKGSIGHKGNVGSTSNMVGNLSYRKASNVYNADSVGR